MRPGPLSEAFLAALPGGSADRWHDVPDLEQQLEEQVRLAAAAWPGPHLPAADFAAHLGRHAGATTLTALRGSDLFLALACARGDSTALDAFERRYLASARPTIARIAKSDHATDDIMQQLRHRLFVGDGARGPLVSDYAGRGDLNSWVLVAATREALTQLRKNRRETPFDDDLVATLPALEVSPELGHMQQHYRTEFKEAFREAVAALGAKDRNVLRLQLVDRLSLDQLSSVYGIHPVTAARRVTRAREALATGTRKALAKRLSVDAQQLDSIFRLFQSQVDVSVHRLLAEPAEK